jgi:phage gp16-like protein
MAAHSDTAATPSAPPAAGGQATPRRRRAPLEARRADLAQIHTLAKELQLSEDAYRDLMATVCGGVRSAALLDVSGRQRFISHLRRCLGRPDQPAARRGITRELRPQERKLWALWMQLAEAGAVQHRTMSALDSYAQRQAGVARVEWLTQPQLDALVESAKQWLQRLRRPQQQERT